MRTVGKLALVIVTAVASLDPILAQLRLVEVRLLLGLDVLLVLSCLRAIVLTVGLQ